MIDSRHELISFYIVFTLLLVANLYSQQDSEVTLLFLFILLILMTMQYKRSLTYLNQLKRYDEVAASIQEHKDWSHIAPLVIEQQEILGIQYNKLMRFIQKQEFRNRRNMQIISIITNSIQDPMVILNINGELEYANNRFKEWVNMSALKKITFQDVKNEPLRKILEDALICESTRKKQLEINQKYYNSTAHPIFNENEDFNGAVVLFHDITEFKKYQILQKEFFGNVSHELKTPISAIKGCTEILINGAKNDSQACDEFLNIIKEENNRMEQLVKDLLLINRYEYDQIKHNTDHICLNELLTDCIVQTLNIANLKNQKITLEASGTCYVQGDYIRLQHCFLNLMTNAIHYSGEETTITIKLRQRSSIIEVEVIDQGIGIPKADIPHIFERFYRVDKARSRHTGGTGLGLSIVLSIIEAHGGSIKVKSELNQGSRFIVTLPEKQKK